MAVTKFSNLTVTSGRTYNTFLAGNPAYVASSYESIATATGTGSSGTITFSGIPSTFKHLQIRGNVRTTDVGATTTNIYVYANGATGSVYTYHYLIGSGATASAAGAASTTFMFAGNATGAASSANTMGVFLFDILDYGSTTKNKTFRYFTGHDQNGSGEVWLASGLYQSTSAISSIEIKTSSGSFTTATTFALYGIKEA